MDKLQELLPKGGPQTIEALIPKLPEDYRRYYTAMYGKESSQPGTFEEPRIISFGKKANFILAFNGHAGHQGGDRIETIRMGADGQFILQELIFDPTGKNPPKPSSDNPDRCLKCHGRPPRPRWTNYRYWPGAYGSMDSRVPITKEEKDAVWRMNGLDRRESVYGKAADRDLSDEEKLPFIETMKEPEKYKAYLEARAKHDRYKHLLLPPAEEGAHGSYLSGFDKLKQFDREPNAMLGFFLHRYNARNLAARAGKSAFAEKYETIFLASLLDCNLVPGTLNEYGIARPKDPEKQEALVKQLNAEITKDLVAIGAKENERFLGRTDLHHHFGPLSLLLGIPQERGAWSLQNNDSYGTHDGSGFSLENIIAGILMTKLDPKFEAKGSLAGAYDEKDKRNEGRYGYIKDKQLIKNLDAIAVGAVNERLGLAEMRGERAKLCDSIRPRVVAAIEKLPTIKVDLTRAQKEAATHKSK